MDQDLKIMKAVETSTELTQTPAETAVIGKVVKKSGKRIGYNYIILKSLKESQKNDVVKCLYIKSLTNFGICVIKEGTYGDSKDREGRDIKDKLIWQKQLHEQLQDKVRLPRYLGSFEENGNYYLVIERIKGKTLYKVCREKSKELRQALIAGSKLGMIFLDYMIQLIDLLERLHENQVIHRDVSANNFIIMPSGKMAVIDMEMGYSFEEQLPSPPFQLGTYGYMSPQQERMQTPSVKDDIFSAGAIMLQVWTGISPSKLTNVPIGELSNKVQFFIPDRDFAGILIQCLHPDPEKRPALAKVRGVIEEYKKDLQLNRKRFLSKPALFQRKEMVDTIQHAIGTLASPLLTDKEQGWFAEDISKPNLSDKRKIIKAWYTSFAKGAAGTMYLLSKARQAGLDTDATMPSLQKTIELIERKYVSRIHEVSPSLHFGSSGIAACLATAIREKLIEPQSMYFSWISRLVSIENKDLDFINGIAGQGMAHWSCFPFLHEGQMQERLTGYARRLLQAQKKNGSWLDEKNKNKKKATKGFARGVAGIVYFLLEYAMQYQEREPLTGAKRAMEWLMKTSAHREGIMPWRPSGKKEIEMGFSDGAPGIALAFMKGYSLLGEPKYKEYASRTLLRIPKNIVDNGLGQWDGLSGLGEVYLEAYYTLGDPVWMERAHWIAQVLMQMKKEHREYGPYWLVEHERQPTPDFMSGNSGVLHFLLRYCYPEIGFPLL